MRRALELSLKGRGRVHPNPLVGAVLAKNGRVLAEGFHARYGGPHAEIAALEKIRTAPAGSTLYVTLEPCAHAGKTPPCVDALLAKKIRRVVIGARDVNPLVSGKGIRALRRAGVRVTEGVLQDETSMLNRDFNHWIRRREPYVAAKAGQSLDGAIATAGGQSKWITSEASRRAAMELRAHADAVLVGVNTVLRDDPKLTVRLPGFRGNPLKIVLDPRLRTPRRAKLFRGAARVLIVTAPNISAAKTAAYPRSAVFLEAPVDRSGRFIWKELLRRLGRLGLVQILIEGGGETIGSAFDAGIVNEVHFFLAPMVLGGRGAVRSVGGKGAQKLASARRFRRIELERLGGDFHYTGIF